MTLFYKLKQWIIGNESKLEKVEAIKEPSMCEQGLALIEELYLTETSQFKANIAELIQFKCISPNIVHFIELIKNFSRALETKETLSARRCFFTEEIISMSSFFEKDGKYIKHSKISDYCKVAEEFYTLAIICEKATVGVDEHNYRMLTKILVSLKDVSSSLLEVLHYQDE